MRLASYSEIGVRSRPNITHPITQAPEHVAAQSHVHVVRYDSRGALVLADVWLSRSCSTLISIEPIWN
jgi:hypothetical protein